MDSTSDHCFPHSLLEPGESYFNLSKCVECDNKKPYKITAKTGFLKYNVSKTVIITIIIIAY